MEEKKQEGWRLECAQAFLREKGEHRQIVSKPENTERESKNLRTQLKNMEREMENLRAVFAITYNGPTNRSLPDTHLSDSHRQEH